jgi:hypothetical protein
MLSMNATMHAATARTGITAALCAAHRRWLGLCQPLERSAPAMAAHVSHR